MCERERERAVSLPSQEARREHEAEREKRQRESDEKCVSELVSRPLSPSSLEQLTRQYAADRRQRVSVFLEHVRDRRRVFFEKACPSS